MKRSQKLAWGAAGALIAGAFVAGGLSTTSQALVTSCSTHADCQAPDERCTAPYNPGQDEVGVCVDVTGQVDVTDELVADLAALPDPAPDGLGVPYALPAGALLRVSDPDQDGVALLLDRRVLLRGNGARLVPDHGAYAVIRVQPRAGASSISSGWSAIRDVVVQAAAADPDTGLTCLQIRGHGVRVEHVHLVRCRVGLDVDGDGTAPFNANDTRVDGLRVAHATERAVWVHGHDSQAGVFTAVEVEDGGGVLDSSFLGNVWVGPSMHAEVCDIGDDPVLCAYSFEVTGSANGSTVIGGYVENQVATQGTADPYGDVGSLYIGGNMIPRLVGGGERVGKQRARLVFADESYTVRIPASTRGLLEATLTDDDPPQGSLRLRFERWEGGLWLIGDAFGLGGLGHAVPHAFQLQWLGTEVGRCSDGVDNDADGAIDGADSECP